MNANNFLKYCLGLSMVIASFALLIYTTTPATADAPTTSYSSGKYQASMTQIRDSDDKQYIEVLMTNTETGESVIYHWKKGYSGFKKLSGFKIPANPL